MKRPPIGLGSIIILLFASCSSLEDEAGVYSTSQSRVPGETDPGAPSAAQQPPRVTPGYNY